MDVPRNQVILLVVGEMAFFFSVINEFHSVVKGQAECDRIGSQFRPAGGNSLVVAGLLRQLLISRLRQEVMKPVLATKRPVTRGPGASAGEPLLKPMPLSPVFGHESAATPHRPTLA